MVGLPDGAGSPAKPTPTPHSYLKFAAITLGTARRSPSSFSRDDPFFRYQNNIQADADCDVLTASFPSVVARSLVDHQQQQQQQELQLNKLVVAGGGQSRSSSSSLSSQPTATGSSDSSSSSSSFSSASPTSSSSEASTTSTSTSTPWCCAARGVTCANGTVVGIDFSYRNLTGVLPAALGKLANLTKLYLNGNSLSGPLPPELGNLAKLVDLSINSNGLTGEIPAALSQLSSIATIDLSSNALSGNIPTFVTSLKGLYLLFLSNNRLTGVIPQDLGVLNLFFVHLENNYLTGYQPQIPSVKVYTVDHNCLSGAALQRNASDCVTDPAGQAAALSGAAVAVIVLAGIYLTIVAAILFFVSRRRKIYPATTDAVPAHATWAGDLGMQPLAKPVAAGGAGGGGSFFVYGASGGGG
ncbi:hypothetical protein DFJ73DRAFT_965995, partial [Zopfochytrium polystomum]